MFRKNLYYSDGKKVESFGIFIVPIVITLMSFPLIDKYPVPFAMVLISLFATIILSSSIFFFIMKLKGDSYLKKHHFQLWKKSKSISYWEKREAQKEMSSMLLQVPYLEKIYKIANKITFTLLVIWTLIFLVIYSLIICSAIWDWPFRALS